MTVISIEPREPGSVLVLAVDGIGSEVMGAALRVLNWFNANRGCRISIVSDSIGGACYDAFGVFLLEQTVDAARRADAILVGAEGGPQWDSIAMQLPPEKAEGVFRLRRSQICFATFDP